MFGVPVPFFCRPPTAMFNDVWADIHLFLSDVRANAPYPGAAEGIIFDGADGIYYRGICRSFFESCLDEIRDPGCKNAFFSWRVLTPLRGGRRATTCGGDGSPRAYSNRISQWSRACRRPCTDFFFPHCFSCASRRITINKENSMFFSALRSAGAVPAPRFASFGNLENALLQRRIRIGPRLFPEL